VTKTKTKTKMLTLSKKLRRESANLSSSADTTTPTPETGADSSEANNNVVAKKKVSIRDRLLVKEVTQTAFFVFALLFGFEGVGLNNWRVPIIVYADSLN